MSLDVSPSAEGMQNMYRQDWGGRNWPSSGREHHPSLPPFSCRNFCYIGKADLTVLDENKNTAHSLGL